MVEVENEASFRAALTSNLNLMLGAGFSVLARDEKGRPLPVGAMLTDELRDLYKIDPDKRLPLAQLYTILAARDRDSVDGYLRERFTVGTFDPRYKVLADLPVSMIFTVNIDNLPWDIYSDAPKRYLNDVIARGPVYNDRSAVDYLPLHGSVIDDSRPFRFTSLEVASSFNADPMLWQTFRRRLIAGPTLFWGHSLQDAAALEALQSAPAGAMTVGDNWIVVRPKDRDDPLTEYLRALRFQIIVADTDELLDYLGGATASSMRDTASFISDSLKQYRVPQPSDVPQRAIVDFYAGAAPAWSDIFRDDMPRVAQFRSAENALNRPANVVITGIPASGKTTLLMQLAASGTGPGVTLMPEALTREGAERLIRALGDAPATVALDSFCDDVDAWNVLYRAANVTVIGADRDYNVATVAHRMEREDAVFISMSEINDLDLGTVRSSIPAAIRTPKMVHPEVVGGNPSLFDFNLANTTSQSLTIRLQDALYEFQREEPVAAEMLLLTSYVHAARTVLSMDMALGYWRDDIADWRGVFLLIDRVGKLLTEYEGELQEEPQDYFAARSTIVAEEVLKAANSRLLRTMLTKFHYNLPTTRICRYDIFRRRGYSHHTVGRAFPEVEGAVEFYDYLVERDRNPYLLQQKALLLSDRAHYADSFVAIDQALAITNRKNWTIQATHAKLLFEANIQLAPESNEAKKQSEKAMGLLRICYLSDRRRSLHAYDFTKQALSYYRVFGDAQARDYLAQAREWLEQVQKREPYMTATKFLLRDVNRKMG